MVATKVIVVPNFAPLYAMRKCFGKTKGPIPPTRVPIDIIRELVNQISTPTPEIYEKLENGTLIRLTPINYAEDFTLVDDDVSDETIITPVNIDIGGTPEVDTSEAETTPITYESVDAVEASNETIEPEADTGTTEVTYTEEAGVVHDDTVTTTSTDDSTTVVTEESKPEEPVEAAKPVESRGDEYRNHKNKNKKR